VAAKGPFRKCDECVEKVAWLIREISFGVAGCSTGVDTPLVEWCATTMIERLSFASEKSAEAVLPAGIGGQSLLHAASELTTCSLGRYLARRAGRWQLRPETGLRKDIGYGSHVTCRPLHRLMRRRLVSFDASPVPAAG
jgi:hypothetical protein